MAKTTSTTGGSSKLIDVTKRDALDARRRKLASLGALIRRRMATIVESFYDVGLALTEVLRAQLYAVDGHASFEAWLAAEKFLSPAQARKLIDIAAHVPRDQALAVGQERAYALISLARATPEPDSAAELIASGVVDGGPAAEAPVRAIKAAATALRDGAPKTPSAEARLKADAALEKGLRAALRAAGVPVTAVTVGRDAVRVELPRAKLEKALAKG